MRRRYRKNRRKKITYDDSYFPYLGEFKEKTSGYSYERLKAEENALLEEKELIPTKINNLKTEIKAQEKKLSDIYKEEDALYPKQVLINQEINSRTERIEEEFYSNPSNRLKEVFGVSSNLSQDLLSLFLLSVGYFFLVFVLYYSEMWLLFAVGMWVAPFFIIYVVLQVLSWLISKKRDGDNTRKLDKLNILIGKNMELNELNKNLEKLNNKILELENKKIKYRKEKIKPLENKINFYETRINQTSHLLRSLVPELIKTARKKEKDARYNAVLGEARNNSQSIKESLLSNMSDEWTCPYCNQEKEKKTVEADHIYPISKGGQSTPQNMVLVCYDCNRTKSDFTLRHFCKVNNLDYEEVTDRLESQGKEI